MDADTKKRIEQLIADMNHYRGGSTSDTIQRPMMATIHAIIAEEQSKSADKVERQTDKLIVLTWALVGLTAVLLLFTAYLSYDVYQHRQHDELNYQSTTEKK